MRRGLTLVELLMALGLSSVVGMIALSLFLTGRDTFLLALDEAALAEATYRIPRDIAEGLEHSRLDLITYGPDSLTYATAYDPAGMFRTDESGRPDWQALQDLWVAQGRLFRGRRPHTAAGQLSSQHIHSLLVEPGPEATLIVRLGVAYNGFRRQFRGEVSLCARPAH